MPKRKFVIKSGNTSNGDLEITDRGNTDARENYVIVWKVKPDSNIDSVTSIDLKTQPNSKIFKSLEATDSPENKRWKGVVKKNAPPGDYLYSIFWNTNPPAPVPYKYDPKIAIKPPGAVTRLIPTGLLLLAGIVSLYLIFSTRKKNRE